MKSRNLLLLSAAAVGALFAVQAFAQSKTATDADKPKQDQSQTSDPSDPEAKARRRAANEAAAKQRGQMVDADEIEVVRTETPRRPPTKRKVVEKPKPAAAARRPGSVAQPLAQPARPGEEFAARHLASKPQSAVASEHLPQSKAAAQLSNDVSKSVSAHLGVFAAAGLSSAASVGASRRRATTSLLKQLRTPQGMRSAIVMQEIMKRPRALRPIQRKPAS